MNIADTVLLLALHGGGWELREAIELLACSHLSHMQHNASWFRYTPTQQLYLRAQLQLIKCGPLGLGRRTDGIATSLRVAQ